MKVSPKIRAAAGQRLLLMCALVGLGWRILSQQVTTRFQQLGRRRSARDDYVRNLLRNVRILLAGVVPDPVQALTGTTQSCRPNHPAE